MYTLKFCLCQYYKLEIFKLVLSLNTLGKNRIALSFSFVVVHTTFLLYSMQDDQIEISSRIICKATYRYMYDSVNIHCNTLVMDDGEENA